MSLYEPIFPSSSPPRIPQGSLPSSISSTSNAALPSEGYLDRIARAHTRISALPNELSDEPSTTSDPNVNLIRERLSEALRHANYNTASAKWGHVARTVRMASTSRRYVGAAQGVVIGEKKEAVVGDYEWKLPETEEQWADCEERWKKRSVRPSNGEGRASKYFANGAGMGELNPTKAEQVRHKVTQWQAKVVPTAQEGIAETDGSPSIANAAKGKGKDGEPKKKQSPLPYSVVKHAALASTSKPPAAGFRSVARAVVPSLAVPSSPKEVERSATPVPPADVDQIRITDVSEMSFLPPSFPAQLATSTPPRGDSIKSMPKRAKPPPIPRRPFPSSPYSSPRMPHSQLERIAVPLASSSSLPAITPSPPRQPRKRVRPASDDTPTRVSVSKKARTHPPVDRTSSVPLPPTSTPPPSTTPPRTPPRRTPPPPKSTGKGLGNAKGLPLPITPHRNIPTLTELLASSRRSKPRPRPPSRKSKSRGTTPARSVGHNGDGDLPVVDEAREPSPALTAGRTLLSSPASGSSNSSGSPKFRPRSPVSPLFSQNVSSFAPPFASTQAGGALGGQKPGALLGRGSSAMIGMGYNSQFDVEGQVGLVSDLLERDVDFDGWLKDLSEVEADS